MSQLTPRSISEFEADVGRRRPDHPRRGRRRADPPTAPDGLPLPPWTPGAHIDLMLGSDLIRQYSLCSSPADPTSYRVAVLHDARQSRRLDPCTRWPRATRLTVRGPRNNFPLVTSARYVFIAGGIGITPMLPMIEEAEPRPEPTGTLHYGGRSAGRRWPSPTSWRSTATGCTSSPRTRPACSTWPRSSAPPPPTPSSTAAARSRCSPRSSSAARAGRPARCTSSASPPSARAGGGRRGVRAGAGQRSGVTRAGRRREDGLRCHARAPGCRVLGIVPRGHLRHLRAGVLEGEVEHRDSVLDADEQEARTA